MLLVVATTAGVGQNYRAPAVANAASTSAEHPGALELAVPGTASATEAPIRPSPQDATADKASVYTDECHQGTGTAEVLTCTYGVLETVFTVYLVGGSHSAHWFPALEEVATINSWRLVSITKSGCLFSTNPPGEGDELQFCRDWNAGVVDLIEAESPDLVVMTSTYDGGSGEHVPEGYLERWAELDRLGVPVVALRDTPRWDTSRPDCVAQYGATSDRCGEPRSSFFADHDPTAQLVNPPPNVHFADLNDFVCGPTRCESVVGNVLVYYDSHHLTATYSRSLAPMLQDALADAGFGPAR